MAFVKFASGSSAGFILNIDQYKMFEFNDNTSQLQCFPANGGTVENYSDPGHVVYDKIAALCI